MSMSGWEIIATSSATVSTTALTLNTTNFTGFTAAQLKAMRSALVSVDANQVRYRQDGTAATATIGHPIKAEESVYIDGYNNLVALSIIRSEAADATVTISLYGAVVDLTPSKAPTP